MSTPTSIRPTTPAPPNTIDFNLPSSSTINLESALPDLSATNIAIVGPGASSLIVERDPALPGTTPFSVFVVDAGATVAISGLTIADGLAYNGGGIDNAGTLTVTNSTLSDNSANGDGGGIHNAGTLTVTNSTLSDNSANGDGGGIDNNGKVTVTNSTLAANSAAFSGGGIDNNGGSAVLDNTIVALNTDGTDPGAPADDIDGTVDTTNSYNNLVGTGGAGGLVNGGNGNLVGVADPGLAPLANYGGPTQTIALLPGSPAIDAGSATWSSATDERGISRPQGSAPDIGAFESQGFTIVVTGGNGQSTPSTPCSPCPCKSPSPALTVSRSKVAL